jgi:hypothetical protein
MVIVLIVLSLSIVFTVRWGLLKLLLRLLHVEQRTAVFCSVFLDAAIGIK